MPTYEFTASAAALIRARGITHRMITPVADGSDSSIVRPSNWHEGHQIVGGTGGLEAGTSFPSRPVTGDLFYRTDRNILYFHDGTRWLSANLFEHHLGAASNVSAAPSPTYTAVWEEDYDVWVEKFVSTMYAASGLTGSAYWTIDLYFWDGGTQGASKAQHSLVSGSNATFTRKITAINALLGASTDAIGWVVTKVSTPGNFYGGSFLTYRLVG